MRATLWTLCLVYTLAACGGRSAAPGDTGVPPDRPNSTTTPYDTPALDAAEALTELINTRTRAGTASAESAVDVDGLVDALVDLGATLREVRSELATDTYPEVTLRFAFGHLPLIVDVVGDDGNYCVDATDDTTYAVAVVGPGPCRADPERLANVDSLFGGDRDAVASHLAGAMGQVYTGHVRPLVDAAARGFDTTPEAAIVALVEDAEALFGPLYGWTFTVADVDGGALVELDAGGVYACGLVTDAGATVAVGGPCPVDAPGTLFTLARPVEAVAVYGYGDDSGLDALWDDCAGGSLASCDTLFETSPVGSLYEAFGVSCGAVAVVDRTCAGEGEDVRPT